MKDETIFRKRFGGNAKHSRFLFDERDYTKERKNQIYDVKRIPDSKEATAENKRDERKK